jgi:asparagine synthase (glutamine-hydrolysing)
MCGIAGILLSPVAPASEDRMRAIVPMTRAIRHRGPDAEGFWCDPKAGVTLGHRRLSIIDLSCTGAQPMHSASDRLVIVFNGEIYNFVDLRRDLEARGNRFRGGSDTEVILAAIEAWGFEAALQRFVGMFALALWDKVTRTLHFARDRIGKKPLYLALTPSGLIFASELKAIHAFPDFPREIDDGAAVAMLMRGWVPDDQCIWRDVLKLPPGSSLSVRARDLGDFATIQSLTASARKWWSLEQVATHGRKHQLDADDEELTDRLDDLLRLAVRQRMVADVRLGAFLSGGIDSSAVVALMQAQSMTPVKTFTVAFGESGFDESDYAARVAQRLGTDHTELRVTASEARDVIPELPKVWDEPFGDESQIPTLLVARLARQHVTVALSGDGGDEAFAGYSRHQVAAKAMSIRRLPRPALQASGALVELIAWAIRHSPNGRLRVSRHLRHTLRADRLARLARLLSAGSDEEFQDRLIGLSDDILADGIQPRRAAVAPALDDLVSRVLFEDTTGYLVGDILVKLDRATMATSLESRCPLLDHRVMEFAWQLPTRVKVRGGSGKWLLRQVLARYLPTTLIERPKQGFDVPVGAWMRGPLREWASDLLGDLGSTTIDGLDTKKAAACWRDHTAERKDHSRVLWSLLMLLAWQREHYRPADPVPLAAPCQANTGA